MKSLFRNGLLAAMGACVAFAACAQDDYPNRTVRVLVGYSPGGATDLQARMLSEGLQKQLGQPFVVENRQGASGVLAAQTLKSQPADGYTLMVATSGAMAIPQNFQKLPYDPLNDFIPIAQIVANDLVMIVNNKSPAKDLKGFVELINSEKGRYSYGVSGHGSITHVAGERLKRELGVDMQVVPYRGDSMAFADTLGGSVPASFVAMPSVAQAVKADQVRALFVTGSKRLASFPQVPTLAELGYPDFVMSSWIAVFAPAGTPAPIVTKLSNAIGKVMSDPDLVEKLESTGSRVEYRDQASFDKFFRQDVDTFARIIREANIAVK
ncbi:tripartite tricarboxylate transporter substrate binding protein [Bordetella sp. BOR01]|uniref:Bug family tripartite tricarboxylate transporter substrate binding protein n=1 Tax=Bordetella sp. BOR01 TaxID=2854779 RepID=UPI001C43B06C|nr:tripartite tricarboxylate transporter substrate binding protein [Bordetella sp. BOR01]MBV7484988.1 tripartite tricarboxylate transporter substrate binding protein [Bordetella sp. BOR01]